MKMWFGLALILSFQGSVLSQTQVTVAPYTQVKVLMAQNSPTYITCPCNLTPKITFASTGYVRKPLNDTCDLADKTYNGQAGLLVVTDKVQKYCRNTLEIDKARCRFPNWQFWSIQERLKYSLWYKICYNCEEPRGSSGENPKAANCKKDLYKEIRRKKIEAVLMTQFANVEPKFLADTPNYTDLLSQMLRRSEKIMESAIPLLSQNDTFQFKVENIGLISLIRSQSEKVGVSNNDISFTLPNQNSVQSPGDRSVIVSTLTYDDDFAEEFISQDQILSKVVSISTHDVRGTALKTQLDKTIHIRFNHDPGLVGDCVFWDFPGSNWSTKGCERTESEPRFTVCSCNHLTNFAVILDLAAPEDNEFLRIPTLVLCSLSILGLLATLVFFLQHRGNDLTERIKINIHFCFNLLAVQLLMVFGADQTEIGSVCKGINILLHFFLLATFTWSLLSGHQIYVLLVQVFDSEKNKMNLYYTFGYLTPFIMVGLGVIVDYAAYQGGTYGAQTHCWFGQINVIFYVLFLVPMILILIINVSMLVLVLVKVYNIKPRPHMFSHARGWFSLALLLGVTWAFGVASKLLPKSFTISLLFVVLNSLQGLLIFIFHVLLGQKCRQTLKIRASSLNVNLRKSSSNPTDNKKHSQTYVITSST